MRLIVVLSLSAIFLTQNINGSVKIKLDEMKKEQRVALIIGNANYTKPLSPLANPTNDAKAIRDILLKRKFEVIYRENINKKDIESSLDEFYSKLKSGGVGLFYFSGHGLELNGENYLIPINAHIRARSDTKYEAISVNKMTDRLANVGNRFNIVILDACRNDPFSRAVGTGGLAKIDPPVGLYVSYSTAAGSVASDGTAGNNGLFTKYLIDNMKKPFNIQQVFKKTRESVYEASNKRQFPAIYDQTLRGEFFFTLPSESKVIETTSTKIQPKPTSSPISESYIQWKNEIFEGKRSYTKNTANTVKDNYTNLIWTKGDKNRTQSWENANSYCQNLFLDGYNNWDLPTKKELQYLSDTSIPKFPAIDTNYFNVGKNLTHHWTKTGYGNDVSHAYGIDFLFGTDDNYDKSEKGYVFCVSR